MRRFFLLTLFLIFVAHSVAWTQLVETAEIKKLKNDHVGLRPVSKPFSLIDLSRVKWSHSYSVNFFSGGGTSGSIGMYTSSIFYELSNSLSFDVQIGIAHNPGSIFNNNTNSNAALYPSFNLDYHPSDNFRLSIGIAKHPGIYYNPYLQNGGYYFNRMNK